MDITPTREYLLDLGNRLVSLFKGTAAPLDRVDVLVLKKALSTAVDVWRPEEACATHHAAVETVREVTEAEQIKQAATKLAATRLTDPLDRLAEMSPVDALHFLGDRTADPLSDIEAFMLAHFLVDRFWDDDVFAEHDSRRKAEEDLAKVMPGMISLFWNVTIRSRALVAGVLIRPDAGDDEGSDAAAQ